MFEILFITALLLDCILGDPRWYPHPVRIIGALASKIESVFRKVISAEKAAGVATVGATLFCAVAVVFCILYEAGRWSLILQFILAVLILYSLVAIKDLSVHSKAVFKALYPKENLELGRKAVGRIVGRDTRQLQSEGISRACIETVAENMVDGITAPLFWAIIFSLFSCFTPLSSIAMAAVGMTMYKTINTMDSMFGYKNEKYIYFGWAPARLDDVANYLPARLSGVMIILTSPLLGYDWKKSRNIFLRDRLNHASPNAGHTEAALAGALGLQLGGESTYFGKTVSKPYMGDKDKAFSPHQILDANRLVLVSSLLFVFFALAVRNICIWLAIDLL